MVEAILKSAMSVEAKFAIGLKLGEVGDVVRQKGMRLRSIMDNDIRAKGGCVKI